MSGMTSRRITRDVMVVPDKAAVVMGLTANGTQFNTQNFVEMLVFIETASVTGTSPTLDITVETKDPVTGNWFTIVTFAQITTATTAMNDNAIATYGFLIPLGQYCRLVYTIGGTTPSFTVTSTIVLKS